MLDAMEHDGISGAHGAMLVSWLVMRKLLQEFPDGYLITEDGRAEPPYKLGWVRCGQRAI